MLNSEYGNNRSGILNPEFNIPNSELRISIITATFNSAHTIKSCLTSLKKQTYKFEHIIIDGGSADGTIEILNQESQKDALIISEPDRGLYDALNKGIQSASGDVIGFLHADDVFADCDVLADVAAMFELSLKNGSMASCYGDLVYVRADYTKQVVRYWKSSEFDKRRFYYGWMPPHPTFFVRKSVYQKYGCFNLELGTSADYELMLRFLLKHGITCGYIPRILVKMRTGGVSNASVKNRLLANYNDRRAWRINGLKPFPWTLYLKPLSKIVQYIRQPENAEFKIRK
ncbi:glycosyltransferase family 2 protein [Desulfococcaceae bacterium HSG9]|nr:glycosyltransferase family 2 protein [Desulfococcaceae bacterium HSG9]